MLSWWVGAWWPLKLLTVKAAKLLWQKKTEIKRKSLVLFIHGHRRELNHRTSEIIRTTFQPWRYATHQRWEASQHKRKVIWWRKKKPSRSRGASTSGRVSAASVHTQLRDGRCDKSPARCRFHGAGLTYVTTWCNKRVVSQSTEMFF